MSVLAKLNGSLSGRAFFYTFGQLSLNFLSVISAPIFVRLMSTSEYGMAAIYFTWVSILSNIVGLRADASIQNAWSEFGERRLPAYVSSVSFLALCFFCLAFIACWCFGQPLASLMDMEHSVLLVCVLTSFFIACSNVRMSYFTVMKNASSNMFVSLLLAASQIACSILLLVYVLDDGYVARIAGYSLPTIIIGAAFLVFFYAKGRKLFDKDYWRFCLGLSLPLIFNGMAYLLINQCDRLMLNAMIGPDAAGIYSFAYSCALPASVLCSAMNSAWTPEYFSLMKSEDEEALRCHTKRYMANMTLISGALMLVSPEILIILGTDSYYSGIPILPMIVMAYYFQYLYTWPVNCEFYFKKTKWMALATLLATALNVALNCLLIPSFGMVGAAFASLAAFAALLVFHDVIARFFTAGYHLSWRLYLAGVLFMIAMMAVSYVFIDNIYIRFAVAGCIALALFVRLFKARSLF